MISSHGVKKFIKTQKQERITWKNNSPIKWSLLIVNIKIRDKMMVYTQGRNLGKINNILLSSINLSTLIPFLIPSLSPLNINEGHHRLKLMPAEMHTIEMRYSKYYNNDLNPINKWVLTDLAMDTSTKRIWIKYSNNGITTSNSSLTKTGAAESNTNSHQAEETSQW